MRWGGTLLVCTRPLCCLSLVRFSPNVTRVLACRTDLRSCCLNHSRSGPGGIARISVRRATYERCGSDYRLGGFGYQQSVQRCPPRTVYPGGSVMVVTIGVLSMAAGEYDLEGSPANGTFTGPARNLAGAMSTRSGAQVVNRLLGVSGSRSIYPKRLRGAPAQPAAIEVYLSGSAAGARSFGQAPPYVYSTP